MTFDVRAAIRDLYDAYVRADGERVAALIHEDIDWIIHGPARVFPFEGPRRGKAQVLDVLTTIGQQFEPKRYTPEIVIVEGDRAAVLVQTSFLQRSTGRTLSIRLVHFMRFQDGKIIEFRELSDTFDVVEQAMGSWLHVPAIAV